MDQNSKENVQRNVNLHEIADLFTWLLLPTESQKSLSSPKCDKDINTQTNVPPKLSQSSCDVPSQPTLFDKYPYTFYLPKKKGGMRHGK